MPSYALTSKQATVKFSRNTCIFTVLYKSRVVRMYILTSLKAAYLGRPYHATSTTYVTSAWYILVPWAKAINPPARSQVATED